VSEHRDDTEKLAQASVETARYIRGSTSTMRLLLPLDDTLHRRSRGPA
jgi:hypothetical protein